MLGRVSVAFLDRFTLFDLEPAVSAPALVAIFVGAIVVCCASALYPALRATRISSAESLHYE